MARLIRIFISPFFTRSHWLNLLSIICLFFSMIFNLAHANSIYRCIKGDKVVFSQTICPKEFSQHKIEYELGITTETDSDKRKEKVDPLRAMLTDQSLSQEKLLQLLNAEVYRLNQEKSYFDILKASEVQKIERKRYWEKKGEDDPDYIRAVEDMNNYFGDLIDNNQQMIDLLMGHISRIEASQIPE